MELTSREQTVADCFAAGQTYKQVAEKLHLSPATVRNHLASIYRKLGVSNKAALIHTLNERRSEFGLLPDPEARTRSADVLRNLQDPGPPRSPGRSIAVLPFETIGTEADAYLGYGLAVDVQHDLTRCHDVLVAGRSSSTLAGGSGLASSEIARHLGVEYLLQGTVRVDRDALRTTAELVEGRTGTVVWSERFDARRADALTVQAAIARSVVRNLAPHIGNADLDRLGTLDPTQLDAHQLRLRGTHLLELGGREGLAEARAHFDHALALDPESAPALAGMSVAFGYECDQLLAENYSESLYRHVSFAERAVAADERDSRGHYALTCARLLEGRFAEADVHARRALELNPSEYHNLCNRGYTLMALGRLEESIERFDRSLRCNPLAPSSCLLAIGLSDYLNSDYGHAAGVLKRMTGYPLQRASTLAAACAQAGYASPAERAAAEFERLCDDLPSGPSGPDRAAWHDFWRRAYPYVSDSSFDHVMAGVGKAGLTT